MPMERPAGRSLVLWAPHRGPGAQSKVARASAAGMSSARAKHRGEERGKSRCESSTRLRWPRSTASRRFPAGSANEATIAREKQAWTARSCPASLKR